MENLSLQESLLSISFLKEGIMSVLMISGLASFLATVTELFTAWILTESLSSLSKSFKIGSK